MYVCNLTNKVLLVASIRMGVRIASLRLPRLVTPAEVPDMAAQLQGMFGIITLGLRLGQNKISHCRLPS